MKQFFYLCSFLWVGLFSQSIEKIEEKLISLKDQMEDIRQILQDLDEKEDIAQDEEKAIHYRILLSEKELANIKLSLKITRNKLKRNKGKKVTLSKEVKILKIAYEERVVNAYKLPKSNWLDALINTRSVEHFLRMRKYTERIHEEEVRLATEISEKVRELELLIKTLVKQEAEVVQLSADQKTALSKLIETENEKKQYIASIKKDKNKFRSSLKKKEKNQKDLKYLLVELRKKAAKSSHVVLSTHFKKNRGKFPWPVTGKVIANFGKNKIKVEGSKPVYIDYTGIDISAKLKTNVKSIHKGVVESVSYMTGFGNTVIVNHGDGYMTIYAHLHEILVRDSDVVNAGDVVGTVGDSGSIDGESKLYFSLWAKEKPVNPRKWLR